jgi:ubiquinone/menaquinone biosynthesis C-methylase UbiE
LERVGFQNVSNHLVVEHENRYIFASRFCTNKKVLDLACGTGYGSEILVAREAKECVGVDISKTTITYAAKKFPDVSYSIMDATQLGFCAAAFDVVCSFETIEHIQSYEKYLSEIKKVLKPGGILIISTPLKEAWSPYGSKSANRFHVKEFSQKEFCEVLNRFFNILELYGQGLCSMRRFILYPYEVLTLGILGKRRIYLDKILNRLELRRNERNLRVVSFRRGRFAVPKYIVAVCQKDH